MNKHKETLAPFIERLRSVNVERLEESLLPVPHMLKPLLHFPDKTLMFTVDRNIQLLGHQCTVDLDGNLRMVKLSQTELLPTDATYIASVETVSVAYKSLDSEGKVITRVGLLPAVVAKKNILRVRGKARFFVWFSSALLDFKSGQTEIS